MLKESASILFRPLARSDFSKLQLWLSAPHVFEWWREPSSFAAIEKKFGPRVDGIEPTHIFAFTTSENRLALFNGIDGPTIPSTRGSWVQSLRLRASPCNRRD
jgi:hypothetical protein